MSELLDQLQPSMRAFFEAFLHGNEQTPDLATLREQQGAELEITVGRYLPYGGFASCVAGYLLLPKFAIHVEPKLVYFTLAQGGGRQVPRFYQAADPEPDQAADAEPEPEPRLPRAHQYSLVKVHERIDPMSDDEATMIRLMADFPTPSDQPPDPEAPAAWARALLAMRQADPEFLRRPLEELTELPASAPTRDVAFYKQVMYAFATYIRNSRGDYYRKQELVGEGDPPTSFPRGTTLRYRGINTEELMLEPGKTYCLVNVPDGWGTGDDRQAGHFREIVFRLDAGEGGAVLLHPVSWATRIVGWGDAPVRDFFDFCFFVTGTQIQELDLPIPEELREDVA